MSFHTFTLPEDRCVRLLVKNLDRGMPESVVRQELESLNIRVQGVIQLRSGRRDQDPTKDRLPTPHFIVSVARGPEVSKVRSLTELCGLRVSVETYVAPKGPLQCKRCQRFGHTKRNCGYSPRCVACGGSHLSSGRSNRGNSFSVVFAGETTRRTTGAVLSGKKQRRRLLSERARKSVATGHPAAQKGQWAGPSAEPMDLGEGWYHVIREGAFRQGHHLSTDKSKTLSSAGHRGIQVD